MEMIGKIRHLYARKNKSEREIARMPGLGSFRCIVASRFQQQDHAKATLNKPLISAHW